MVGVYQPHPPLKVDRPRGNIFVGANSERSSGEALPSSAKHPGLTSSVSSNLGLTLVHFTAQRKHILWDSVGYVGCIISPQSIELGDTGRCDQDGLG